MPICIKCGTLLTDENWYPSGPATCRYICKSCTNSLQRAWAKANPEKRRKQVEKSSRKRGGLPMSENKESPQFLGCHIAERVLQRVFKNVEKMPYNNRGYDFICNKGKKIDVKSACLYISRRRSPKWTFAIRQNTVADYFLCLAFDNRESLKPMYLWLLPGSEFNHLMAATIYTTTVSRWEMFKLPLNKVIMCCNSFEGD